LVLERLLVIHPHLSVIGGSEELTRMLIEELSSMDFEVGVVTREPRELPESVPVWRIVKGGGYGVAARLSEVLQSLSEALHEFEPDACLVMIHEPVYAAAIKMISPGTPVGIYIHFPIEEEVTERNVDSFYEMHRFPIFEPRMYLLPDVHMANSLYTARALYRMFGIEANVVYPCISRVYTDNEPDLDSEREPIILSVGRIVPQKNHEAIIRAFRVVRSEVPDARLVIVGSVDPRYENYFRRIQRLVEETRGVELEVSPPRDRLLELYRRADVYVHARLGEHFGLAPLEAMSQGAIVVAHESLGLLEILNPGREVLVYRRFSELGKAIVRALRMPIEEKRAVRLRARSRALYFSQDRFAKEVIGYLRAATEVRDSRRRWASLGGSTAFIEPRAGRSAVW